MKHLLHIAHQPSLLWDSDASKQLGEPGIGAQRVPECFDLQVGETIELSLAGFFKPQEGLVLVLFTLRINRAYCGILTRRSSSANRGSERRGSQSASTFR